MRFLFAFCATLFAALPGQAAVIGDPLVREGLEIVPSTLTGVELDRRPAGAGGSSDSVFLEADVHAAKDEAYGFAEHAFIPYLSISFALTKDGAPTFKRAGLLFPIASKNGPRYGAVADMAGPGTYHLTYIVSPPSSHGMLRQTGKDGVADWWKPITANWTFAYPGQNTASSK
jgi:uncharacterized protein involved in high-affinity Fe2+ transport